MSKEILIPSQNGTVLNNLEIKPNIYFICAKFLDTITYMVVKDDSSYVFFKKSWYGGKKKKGLNKAELLEILLTVTGMNTNVLEVIIDEWWFEKRCFIINSKKKII